MDRKKSQVVGIRKEDGWTHCFSCGESVSLCQMISRCFGVDDLGQYGLNWLKNNFLGEVLEQRSINIYLDRKLLKNENNTFVDEQELDSYRYIHHYMYKRKLDDRVIEIFDLGFDKKTNEITFPVRDKEGNCLFIARRNVDFKRFSYPANVEKPLYGLYELYQLKQFPDEIYVVESMIDCCYLWKFNKFAVALNGLGNNLQFKQLRELPCRKIILATDSDEAGQKARKRIKENIENKIITEIKIPNNRKDINDCTEEEVINLEEIW